MKKNELGFMLAETLIVATFISVILIYLFVYLLQKQTAANLQFFHFIIASGS